MKCSWCGWRHDPLDHCKVPPPIEVATEPIWPELDPEENRKWARDFQRKWRELQEKFGKGETYDLRTRELIRARIVPEWVFRGMLLATDENHARRCRLAVLALEKLHAEIFGEESFSDER